MNVSAERTDIAYPTNHVVGTITDAGRARAAIDALVQAGFDRQAIAVLHGEEDLHRLETDAGHGLLAQFGRKVSRAFELQEFKHLTHHLEDVRKGRTVIMVRTKRRGHRIVAADILHRYGAEFVGFYGRWAWEGLPGAGQASPEQIPAAFARAWNDRNPDAIASLFDEDAEFVHVTGMCCHDRDSIRKAHADGQPHTSDSMLAIDDVKVRRLSPDIALVHARMTLSGQGAAAQAAPRTTIVSFVVHRTGDRWVCASAHNTDVIPGMSATVISETAATPSASYPAGEV